MIWRTVSSNSRSICGFKPICLLSERVFQCVLKAASKVAASVQRSVNVTLVGRPRTVPSSVFAMSTDSVLMRLTWMCATDAETTLW